MIQKDALTHILLDILMVSKKRYRVLKLLLILSLVINVALFCFVFRVCQSSAQVADDMVLISALCVKKPTEHIATRTKLKNIASVKTFDELINQCTLTDEEKYIVRQHYLHGRSFQSIAQELNFSEDWIKHKHQKILKKIQKLL